MNNPLVSIIMGSESDMPIMQNAVKVCEEFGVECEVKVVSAHRSPELAETHAREAAGRGIKVIIAGAGGAAHLAGVTAAHTTLPVIGVPIKTPAFDGIDSLLSTMQMPPGVPVATVAIDGARNAGILAIQILSTANPQLVRKLVAFKKSLYAKYLKT